MKQKKALLFFLLLKLSLQCGNGCLKCSVEDICEVCDSQNAFFLKEGKCEQRAVENCDLYNLEGKCLLCKEQYYLSVDSKKCLLINQKQKIENCALYGQSGLCVVCAKDHYLKGGICEKVELVIEKCLVYNSKSTCQECSEGFLVTLDQKNCRQILKVDQCLSYSLNQCVQCNEDSVVDFSYDVEQLRVRAEELTLSNQQFIFSHYSGNHSFYHEFCVQTKIQNCAEFEDYKTCTKCRTGFYLEKNECKANPSSFINKCLRYSSFSKCIECEQGFFLQTDSSCVEVTVVENCLLYDGTTNSSRCKQCLDGFYLSALNKCTERTKIVESCSVYETDQEKCQLCSNGMLTTSDGLKCLQKVENCVTYVTSSSSSASLSCSLCKSGMYLSNGVCTLGTKTNCLTYSTTSDTCQVCQNKYYLQGGECVAHSEVSNCLTYSKTLNGVCEECNVGTAQFVKSTKCVEVDTIQGCSVYSATDKCQTCEDGYNRVSDVLCELLPANSPCLYQNAGVCQKCKSGYYLENNECKTPLTISHQFCETPKLEEDGDYPCDTCTQFSVPYNHTGQNSCVSSDAVEVIRGTYQLKDNCDAYKYVAENDMKCIRCKPGFYLDTTNDVCLQQCDTTIKRFVLEDNGVVYRNVRSQADLNCDVVNYRLQGNTAEYFCTKCSDGYIWKENVSETKTGLSYSDDMDGVTTVNSLYNIFVGECLQNQNLKLLPDVNNNIPLDKCMSFYYFDKTQEYGCLRCQQGYSGMVKNWGISNCKEFDANQKKCSKCLNEYDLNGDLCEVKNEITNCDWYSEVNANECERCKVNFYLQNANTCTPIGTVVQNCKEYFVNQDKCAQCQDGYIFSNNSNFCIKKISRCNQYVDINQQSDPVICVQCEDGYYPSNGGSQCTKGNVDFCWKYDQSKTNKCQSYLNYIFFKNNKQCVKVNQIDGCTKYSDKNTCDTCNSDSHYKSGGICCGYRKVNISGQCQFIEVNNCKRSTSLKNCDECLSGFYPDNYQDELNPPHKCCGENTYWHPDNLLCSSLVDMTLNTIKCSVWEYNKQQCVACKDGSYATDDTGYCCTEGNYHKVVDDQHTCADITPLVPNCLRYDPANTNCTKCKSQYFLENGICCKTDEQYQKNGQCHDNLAGCIAMNTAPANPTECTTCHSDYFLAEQAGEPKICCKYKNLNGVNPGWYEQGDSCSLVNPPVQITGCIKYLHNADANLRKCGECESGFFLSGDQKHCCPQGKTWNGQLCVNTALIAKYCLKLDTANSNVCTECIDGYYLSNKQCVQLGKIFDTTTQSEQDPNFQAHPGLKNCDKISNDNNCDQCSEGYGQNNGKCQQAAAYALALNEEVPFSTYFKDCHIYNTDTNYCEYCSGSTYLQSDIKTCVPIGKYYKDNLLQDIPQTGNLEFCIKMTNGTDCAEYNGNNIDNCKVATNNNTVCSECDLGYLLNQGECKSISDVHLQCTKYEVSINCKEVNLTDCTCSSCQDWAYGNHCCSHGTWWKNGKCVDNKPLCAEQSTDTKCDKCFISEYSYLTVDNFKYQYVERENILNQSEQDPLTPFNEIYSVYKSSNNDGSITNCCPVKYYWDDTANGCLPITISGCEESLDNSDCTKCESNKRLYDGVCCNYNQDNSGGAGTCTNIVGYTDDCAPNHYKENDICCKKGFFYDIYEQECIGLISDKCLESTSPGDCKTADTDYSVIDDQTVLAIDLPQRPFANAYYEQTTVKLPWLTTALNNYMSRSQILSVGLNCKLFDLDNDTCTTCDTGYHKDNDICCPDGYTAVSTGNIKYCHKITELLNDCLSFDPTTKVCKSCKDGKNLSYGKCCADKTFLSKYSHVVDAACNVSVPNCYNYSAETESCLICDENFHLSNGVCVSSTQYYSKTQKAIRTMTDDFENCLDVSDNEYCVKADTGTYLDRGQACLYNNYWDSKTSQCKSISTLGSAMSTCKRVDFFRDCLECTGNTYLTNGRCCPYKQYWDMYKKECQVIFKYKNCKEASKDKETVCKVCDDGYYISGFGMCAQEGKVVVDEYGTTLDINITDCLQAEDANSCSKCTGSKIVYDNTCTEYDQITGDQRIGECKIINAGSPPTCSECETDYYLTNNSKSCCQQGTYFNGVSCVSLSTVSVNCLRYENGVCSKCGVLNNAETYLSNESACCPEGQYATSNTQCSNITQLANCLQTDNHTKCNKCANNFQLNGGQCENITIQNCLIGKSTTECQLCANNFYLQADGTCAQQDTIQECTTMTTNENTCSVCSANHYYDGKRCCPNGQYTRISGVKTADQICQPLVLTNNADCQQINDGVCTGCESGKYLSSDQCCDVGTYYDGANCVASTAAGLAECDYFVDANKCEYREDDSGTEISCQNGFYFHEDHCCPNDQHWNGTACAANSTVTKYTNCQQVENGMCRSCSAGYYSEGFCCDTGKYHKLGQGCINIPITDCEKFDGVECQQCSSTLNSFNRCCDGQVYREKQKGCVNTNADWGILDIFNDVLVTCAAGKYPISNDVCCSDDEYWKVDAVNGDGCVAFATATDCKRTYKTIDTDTYANCRECSTADHVNYFDEGCEDLSGTDVYVKIGGNITAVNNDALYTNCSSLDADGLCDKCKADFNLGSGLCCADGSVAGDDLSCKGYDDATANGVPQMTNCKNGLKATCSACDDGFFLRANDTATEPCCDIGRVPLANGCGDGSNTGVANCISYPDINVATKCQTCKDGYALYTDPDDADVTMCCGYVTVDGVDVTTYPNSDFTACITYAPEIGKCSNFDTLNNTCQKCSGSNYLTNLDVCCDKGKFFDTATESKCKNIAETNCEEYSTKCDACENNFYLIADKCCQYNFTYTGGNCLATSNAGVPILSNCKEAQTAIDSCKVCQDGFHLMEYTTGKSRCCTAGQYADNNGVCQNNTITNCKWEKFDANGNQCSECDANYEIISNSTNQKDACCKKDEFAIYNNDNTITCKNKYKIGTSCLVWDRKNLECTKCNSSTYLVGGRCCSSEQYSSAEMDTCEDITAIDNCVNYNVVDGCTKCSTSYLLNKNKSTVQADACVQGTEANGYLGCLTYTDNLDKCLTCKASHYLHRDRCVIYGKQRKQDGSNFEDIPTAIKCKEVLVDDTNNTLNKCSVCIDNHYLVNSNKQCCPNGQYWDTTTSTCKSDGSVNNCLYYNDNKDQCVKCQQKYLLAVLKDNKHRCISFAQDNSEICLETQISEVAGYNQFQCSLCQNQFTEYVLEDFQSSRVVPYLALTGCEYYDTQPTLSQSTLKCHQCYKNDINYLKKEEINGVQTEICTLRTGPPANCTKYEIDKDNCLACVFGYHLIEENGLKRCKKNENNCSIYRLDADICDVCDPGYKIIKDADGVKCRETQLFVESAAPNPNFFPAYIETCQRDEMCSEKRVSGVSPFVNRIFSCHLCKNNDQIPFVSFKGNDNQNAFLGLSRYIRPQDSQTRQDTAADFKSTTCLRPVADSFNLSTQNFNFPSKCALGLINATHLPSAGEANLENPSTNLSIFCVACKAGHQPTYSQLTQYNHVYKCDQIKNCAEKGENFNECKRCEIGYSFDFSNDKVLRDRCVQSSDKNCLSFDSVNNTCIFCKDGYSFNYDNKCELIVSPNCKKMNLFRTQQFPDKARYELIMRSYREGYGCQECESGYTLIKNQPYNSICTYSPQIEKQEISVNSQNYQKNCVLYDATSFTLKCKKCNDVSILDKNGKCLDINDNIKHCKLAESTTVCQKCNAGYVLHDSKCRKAEIDNCTLYIDNTQHNDIKCAQCDNNFGLQNNVCIKDLFNSCLQINDDDKCVACQDGYQLTTLKDDQVICIPVAAHQNCSEFDSDEFSDLKIKCTQCSTNKYFLQNLSPTEKVCNQFLNIKNCIEYDLTESFSTSTLKCLDCKVGYYLSNNQCIMRNVLVEGCKTYQLTSQLCEECEKEYFLREDKKKCIKNPTGVSNCRVYQTDKSCKECIAPYYLSNTECKKVETANLVTLCQTYSETQKCTVCPDNYLLEKNECIAIKAQNCLEVANPQACKTCDFGFTLAQNEGIISCVEIEKPSISNCLRVSDTSPFICEICETEYYPDSDKCVELEKPIKNCEIHLSPFICKKCFNYHILSEDKSFCSPLKNQNCLRFQELKETFCVICAPGYELKEGNCQKMTQMKENCLLYESIKGEGDAVSLKCVMCQSGYTMNKEGVCKLSELSDQAPDTTDDSVPEKEFINIRLCQFFFLNVFLQFFF